MAAGAGRKVQINPIPYERRYNLDAILNPGPARDGEIRPQDMSQSNPGGIPFVRRKDLDKKPGPVAGPSHPGILVVKRDPYTRRPQSVAVGFSPPKPVGKPDPMEDPFLKPAYRTYMKKMIDVAPTIPLPQGFAVSERNASFKEYLERRGRHLIQDYRAAFEPTPPKPRRIIPHKRYW